MIIKYLKENSVDLLKKQDINKNVKYYNGDNSWIIKNYNETELFAAFNKIEFNDFELVYKEGILDDYENMKIMYENLKELTDSQASDERVWSGLAHSYFWDYMQKRWPLPQESEKQISHVLNNYFFWNSTKAPFLNGLSRLWWYARYTYDEENPENRYELTKYICENDINGKIFPLLACKFATSKEVFKNIIRAVKKYEEENNVKLSRDEFGELKKYLNRLSGKIVIDILSKEELYKKVKCKLDKILKSRV